MNISNVWKTKASNAHEIDEYVHDASKVSDHSRRREEKAVSHDLQDELDAHEDHKDVLSDLENKVVEGLCSMRSSWSTPPFFILPAA